jgi:hypothetical protein
MPDEGFSQSCSAKVRPKLRPLTASVQVGMPDEVIQEAKRIAHSVREEETVRIGIGASAKQGQLEAMYSLAHKVACVAQAFQQKAQGLEGAQTRLAALKREANRLLHSKKHRRH